MIPEYDAIQVLGVVDVKYGRTRPWIILANTEKGPRPFVVKLFTTAEIQRSNSVAGEVISNRLAAEFELKAPEMAFIHLDETNLSGLTDEMHQQLEAADPRAKFATALVDGFYRFDKKIPKTLLAKRVDIDTLFAFDNLIRNAGRGQQKPNLLITKHTAWLIDHEFTFNLEPDAHILQPDTWNERYTTRHIFFDYLKKAGKETKSAYFGTFLELLKTVRFESLLPWFTQLNRQGFAVQPEPVIAYLNNIKNKLHAFVSVLTYRL
jgi:hypothetical protein